MRHRGRRPASFAAVVLLAASCALPGCARRQEAPPPAPRAPRALTVSPQQRQSQTRQDRDKSDCQSMASSQATSSESWAQIFTACMSGRGYLVE